MEKKQVTEKAAKLRWFIGSLIVTVVAFTGITILDNAGGGLDGTPIFQWVIIPVIIILVVNMVASTVSLIRYFIPKSAKERQRMEKLAALKEKAAELEYPATIVFNRGENDGSHKKFWLKIFNNEEYVGMLSVGKKIIFDTKTNINILTIAYIHPYNENAILPIKDGELILELSDREKVNVCYDNKKLEKESNP